MPGTPTTLALEASPERRGFLPPYPVIACVTVFFWSLFSRGLVYTIMPTVGADLRLSSATVGAVIASLLLGNSVGQWSGARLPSSRKVRILAGTALSIPAAALLSRADSLWLLLVTAPVLGFGTGIYQPIGISLVVEYAGTHNRARYMALHEFVGTAGSFFGSASIAFILALTDWHGAILGACLVGLVAAIAFIPVSDTKYSARSTVAREPIPVDGRIVYSVIAQVSVAILLMGMISVLPLIMVRAWGLSQAEAASAVGYTRLAGLVGVFVAGINADRWGHQKAILFFQVVSVAGIATMSLSGYGPVFIFGMLVLAAGAVGTVCLLPLVVSAAYSGTQRESALGTMGSIGGLVGMVGAPALFGYLIDAGLPTSPMQIATALAILAILATRRISPGRT